MSRRRKRKKKKKWMDKDPRKQGWKLIGVKEMLRYMPRAESYFM